MAKAAKSTVVIPAFNNAALTKQCLDALVGVQALACPGNTPKRGLQPEIIVVDDASTDSTAKMLTGFGDKIKVITHKRNSGFAKSCNDGAKAARSEFVVFLNNDTIPQPSWLRALENYAKKNPKAAVVGSKLVYPNNTIQHAGVVICQDKYPRHIYTGFPADHPAVNQSRRFQIVTAASILVRRKIFAAMRGFDAKFQNGFEDVDFCLRLAKVAADVRRRKNHASSSSRPPPHVGGYEIHYCAESVVQHFESVAPGRFKHDRDNVALYRKRWLAKVQPDDVDYFIADGLLKLAYEGSFPLHLKVSPLLATLDDARARDAEQSLADRARQIGDLTRENTKLRAELGGAATASPALEYDRLRERLRELASLTVPADAKALVISKGDGALLQLGGIAASHFPQSETGGYAGYHPADGHAAVAELKRHLPGAEYLVIPEPSLWWLEHYGEFRAFLERGGRLVGSRPSVGQIYFLGNIRLARPKKKVRVVAIMAVHNEERFIGGSLRHLTSQGVQVHLIDNGSTDRTVKIAQTFLGRGLLHIEPLPHDGVFRLPELLRRKEELATTLDADWIMHVDADEIPLSPREGLTLGGALAAVDEAGYNVVNFVEFTFIPVRESPDHDHADFQKTMRWYYPFLPQVPWHLRAWKKTSAPVSLAASGGHLPHFAGARLCPEFFRLKHYQFLSVAHAGRKYGARKHDPRALQAGLHGGPQGWRNRFRSVELTLPSRVELREFCGNDKLDASQPWTTHFLQTAMQATPPKV